MSYLDLTLPINATMPVDPADPPPNIQAVAQVEQDGYTLHTVTLGTHTGTHMDAPIHMIVGGKTLDQFPVDAFVGRGRLIVLIDKTYDIGQVRAADIQAGDVVLFRTGMSDLSGEPSYFSDYPAISEEIAQFLVEKRVKMVGVDACGPDHDPFPVHKILLGADVLILENLTNLKTLEGKDFTVFALPLALEDDGAPARVIAEIKE